MASSSLHLAVLFLLALVSSAIVPATGGKNSGARMVIIRGSGTRVGGGAQSNKWQQRQHYRRLEDEVTPELGGLLLGAGEGGTSYNALEKDRPVCPSGSSQCAAKGGSYTRGCTYVERCPH